MKLSKDLHPMQLDCLGHLSATFQVIPKHERPVKYEDLSVLMWNARGITMLQDVPDVVLEDCTDNPLDFWKWYDIWLSGEEEDTDG